MIEELIKRESKNIEFKEILPGKAENYVKTVIAFANSQGGSLIFGIEDQTHKVIGIDKDILFDTMDAISNAVSDLCMPQIVPNIEPQTIDGKTVVLVTVSPGTNRPYYLKAKGKEKGTYIRVGATSRPALPDKILELEMEGARISWDELTCLDYKFNEESIEQLCNDIMSYRQKVGLSSTPVTKNQLINWKVLKEDAEQIFPSNAFALMTSDHFQFSKTQCAVFKGTTRNVFLDKRTFEGPLYKQIEEAIHFVLRNIRLGATVEGLLRKESYELPVEAIREMIVNAHCHRNYLDEACIQVALFDDRLEVTSPGGLYNGLTYEEMMTGHSKTRNRAIAKVFNQMGIIEAWGTGIQRILSTSERYDLPTPEIIVTDNSFRVTLYRQFDDDEINDDYVEESFEDIKGKEEIYYNKQYKAILEYMKDNVEYSSSELKDVIGVKDRRIRTILKELLVLGAIESKGSTKNRRYKKKLAATT